jgi:hypothetical protein
VTAAEAVMKPRRDSGATFVNPTTSDVSMGSALMAVSPRLLARALSKQSRWKANHQPARTAEALADQLPGLK